MKSKTPFIILGLVVLAAAAFALSRPTAGDPYETFTLALDRLAGPGQWSAQSHASGGDGLTVTGLSVTLPPATDGGRPEALTIESVLIKNGPSKSWLEKILAAGNWQNQPAAALAENVKLAGLRLQAGRAEGECEVRVEELTGAGVNLAAAAQGAPAGPAGFLKALRIGSLGYKNLQFTLKAGEAEAVSTVVALTAEELAFDGETAPELAVFDPSGLLTALGGLSAKSLKAEGLGLNFIGRAEESKVTSNLSIASVEHKDFRALKSIGSLRLNNLKGSLTGPQDHVVTWALADLSLTGLDAGAYMAQLLPGLAALKTNPDDTDAAEKLLAGSQNLAGFFVSPISLDDATLAGLEFSLGDLASIKLAESRATGPYRAGEVPPRVTSSFRGLEITLSDKPAPPEAPEADQKIYEFIKNFGMNHFIFEGEAESAYDPRTGAFTARLTSFKGRDLFEISAGLKWGGLTPARLEKLKGVSLAAPALALLNPDDILGDASLDALDFKYTDQGLVERIFRFQAAVSGEGQTAQGLRKQSADQLELLLQMAGPKNIKNSEALSRPLVDFLRKSQVLEINLAAEPPLSFASTQALGGRIPAILDTLHITVSANGQAGAPLQFVTGPSGGPLDDHGLNPGQYEDEEDEDTD